MEGSLTLCSLVECLTIKKEKKIKKKKVRPKPAMNDLYLYLTELLRVPYFCVFLGRKLMFCHTFLADNYANNICYLTGGRD